MQGKYEKTVDMEKLTVIKVGGKVVEEQASLERLLDDFAGMEGRKLLVHGGGRSATRLATLLGIESRMVDGRRITDAETLKVVTMVYAGLVNKNVVAGLQKRGVNALGLCGADLASVVSDKRPLKNGIDYGFVGDVKKVNGAELAKLINGDVVPVMAPLSFSFTDGLLNTNADTMAGEIAKAMSGFFDTTLTFCFEKRGVLRDEDDDDSVIESITPPLFEEYKQSGVIRGGMIPKLENAFAAINAGVKKVVICNAAEVALNRGTVVGG